MSRPALLSLDEDAEGLHAEVARGRNGQIFGGQLSAHCVAAAASATGGALAPHSIHLHFVASGDAGKLVRYIPSVVRAGRSFTIVRVDAVQDGRVLATSTSSFHAPEHSDEHGVHAQGVPPASACEALDLASIGASPVWDHVEARVVGILRGDEPAIRLWMRWREQLGTSPVEHSSALAWMTDLLMVRTARLGMVPETPIRPGPSLDHALWFHRELAADDWLYVEVHSLVRSRARAFNEARVFDQDGVLVATSTQECLLR
ncbi:MAG: acyl-CoA thioesterase [Candidatus Nanopelagicales bacterium]